MSTPSGPQSAPSVSPLPSPGPQLVLDAPRRHADPQGHAAPGLTVLADQLAYSPRRVERHLQHLRDDGLIEHVQPGRRLRPARYRVLDA